MLKQYILYLIRWQLSSPILAFIAYLITDKIIAAIIANFVGGLIFFWIDRFIFTSKYLNPLWEIKANTKCFECGKKGYGFRIALKKNYDKTKDPNPEFRCYECAQKKAIKMGITI